MTNHRHEPTPPTDADRFAQGAEGPSASIFAEFWAFLRYNRKWWLTPVIVILLLLAGVVLLGPAAPFIYTLF